MGQLLLKHSLSDNMVLVLLEKSWYQRITVYVYVYIYLYLYMYRLWYVHNCHTGHHVILCKVRKVWGKFNKILSANQLKIYMTYDQMYHFNEQSCCIWRIHYDEVSYVPSQIIKAKHYFFQDLHYNFMYRMLTISILNCLWSRRNLKCKLTKQ